MPADVPGQQPQASIAAVAAAAIPQAQQAEPGFRIAPEVDIQQLAAEAAAEVMATPLLNQIRATLAWLEQEDGPDQPPETWWRDLATHLRQLRGQPQEGLMEEYARHMDENLFVRFVDRIRNVTEERIQDGTFWDELPSAVATQVTRCMNIALGIQPRWALLLSPNPQNAEYIKTSWFPNLVLRAQPPWPAHPAPSAASNVEPGQTAMTEAAKQRMNTQVKAAMEKAKEPEMVFKLNATKIIPYMERLTEFNNKFADVDEVTRIIALKTGWDNAALVEASTWPQECRTSMAALVARLRTKTAMDEKRRLQHAFVGMRKRPNESAAQFCERFNLQHQTMVAWGYALADACPLTRSIFRLALDKDVLDAMIARLNQDEEELERLTMEELQELARKADDQVQRNRERGGGAVSSTGGDHHSLHALQETGETVSFVEGLAELYALQGQIIKPTGMPEEKRRDLLRMVWTVDNGKLWNERKKKRQCLICGKDNHAALQCYAKAHVDRLEEGRKRFRSQESDNRGDLQAGAKRRRTDDTRGDASRGQYGRATQQGRQTRTSARTYNSPGGPSTTTDTAVARALPSSSSSSN